MNINNVLLTNQSYLNDREFLSKLDQERNKVLYAKIIALTLDEDPIEEIQGRVTQGNVTIDGKSCVRRTCSVFIVANELNVHDYYWGLNTKFQFFIGCKNNIEPKYPEIIWFKMGTYLISSFSTSQTVNSYTIQVQGKDKMCMLNGEIGGVITPLTWDFGTIENIQDDGSKIVEKYLIKNIITEAVHEHAREPFYNIIVNDLDDLALELLEYRGDKTMFLLYCVNKRMVTNFFIPDSEEQEIKDLAPNLIGPDARKKFKNITPDPMVSKFRLDESNAEDVVDKFYIDDGTGHYEKDDAGNNIVYTMIRVEYGETIGYRITDLTYPGDLISNVGESVTSMLDKIVAMLGNYEYFYNVDGQFVFQRKPVYYEASWNNIVKKQDIEYIQVPAGSKIVTNRMYFWKDGSIMHEYYEYNKETWDYYTSLGLMYYAKTSTYQNYNDNTLGTERYVYSFNDNVLVTSFSNAPNLMNLKNDYSIWGKRKGVTGAEIPIHLRYAIDKKPLSYTTFDGISYATQEGYNRTLDLFDQAKNNLGKEITEEFIFFTKQEVPTYLQKANGTSDWWDLVDWANYYEMLTGNLPNKTLKNYCTEPFYGSITFPDQCVYTASTTGMTYINNAGENILNAGLTNRKSGQLIFDVYRSNLCPAFKLRPKGELSGGTSWNPFQHGAESCVHTYSEFITMNNQYDFRSFIYKPEIPVDVTTITDENHVIIVDTDIDEQKAAIDRLKALYTADVHIVDWRELIYQMALDYRRHNHDEDFYINIIENNLNPLGESWYPKGYTGYEPYYIDLEGFWRQIYDPDYTYTPEVAYVTQSGLKEHYSDYYVWENVSSLENIADIQQQTSDGETYYTWTTTGSTQGQRFANDLYYRDYLGRYMKVTSPIDKINTWFHDHPDFYWYLRQCTANEEYSNQQTYFQLKTGDFDADSHWSQQVLLNPAGLNFWFDFLDGDSDLERYNVQNIGDRPKAENDDKVKAIYFRDIPEVIFIDKSVKSGTLNYERQQRPGYAYVKLTGHLLNNLFTTSRQGKSAMDKLDTFLYQYACCTESITINSLPIYYLEPNTRILVDDNNSNLHGEYLIERLSIPLSNSGTMSITATKAIEKLY